MPTFDLIVIGHVSFDEDITRSGTKTSRGEAAYYAALAASLYSKNIGLVSRIGKDYDRKDLEALHIDLEGVKQDQEKNSSRFYHEYLAEDGSLRSWRGEFNAGADLNPSDIPPRYFDAKRIHIATMPPKQQLTFLELLRGRTRASLSVDTIEPFLREIKADVLRTFSLADCVFMDRNEHAIIGDIEGKEMIIKRGSEGAEYVFGDRVVRAKAPAAEVVSKTGSGDVLAGVFLVWRSLGYSVEDSLQEAVRIASLSVTDFGVEHLLAIS